MRAEGGRQRGVPGSSPAPPSPQVEAPRYGRTHVTPLPHEGASAGCPHPRAIDHRLLGRPRPQGPLHCPVIDREPQRPAWPWRCRGRPPPAVTLARGPRQALLSNRQRARKIPPLPGCAPPCQLPHSCRAGTAAVMIARQNGWSLVPAAASQHVWQGGQHCTEGPLAGPRRRGVLAGGQRGTPTFLPPSWGSGRDLAPAPVAVQVAAPHPTHCCAPPAGLARHLPAEGGRPEISLIFVSPARHRSGHAGGGSGPRRWAREGRGNILVCLLGAPVPVGPQDRPRSASNCWENPCARQVGLAPSRHNCASSQTENKTCNEHFPVVGQLLVCICFLPTDDMECV